MPPHAHHLPARWPLLIYRSLLFGSAAVSLAVVVSHLAAPYWFDEALTLFYLRQPIRTMVVYTANDWFPPAYYFLLRPWVALVGAGEAATAALSLLFAIAAGVLTYRLGRRLFDRDTAGRACLLFAVSGSAVYFSTETRMYTLLMALAVAASMLFFAILDRPRRLAVHFGYAAVALFGVYTHYAFWFLVFAHGVMAALLGRRERPRARYWLFAATQLALLIVYLPQWFVVWDKVTSWYLAPEVNWIDRAWRGASIFWRLPQDMVFFEQLHSVRWLIGLGWMVVVALLLAPWLQANGAWRQRSVQIRLRDGGQPLLLLAGQILIPVAMFYVLRVYVPRYVIFLTPIFCLQVARGVHYLRPRLLQQALFGGLVVSLGVINVVNALQIPKHYQTGSWPALAEFLERQPVVPGLVIAANFDDSIALDHYYDGQLPFRRLWPALSGPNDDPVAAAIRWIGRRIIIPEDLPRIAIHLQGIEAMWLVRGPGMDMYDPERLIDDMLEHSCTTVSPRLTFPRDSLGPHGKLAITQYRDCAPAAPAP